MIIFGIFNFLDFGLVDIYIVKTLEILLAYLLSIFLPSFGRKSISKDSTDGFAIIDGLI